MWTHAYLHTCIHAYLHTCIHAYLHTCLLAYLHLFICAYLHTCAHSYLHTCILAYGDMWMYAYLHTYFHTCKLEYLHTCILANSHTCIHVHMCILAYVHTCICVFTNKYISTSPFFLCFQITNWYRYKDFCDTDTDFFILVSGIGGPLCWTLLSQLHRDDSVKHNTEQTRYFFLCRYEQWATMQHIHDVTAY